MRSDGSGDGCLCDDVEIEFYFLELLYGLDIIFLCVIVIEIIFEGVTIFVVILSGGKFLVERLF